MAIVSKQIGDLEADIASLIQRLISLPLPSEYSNLGPYLESIRGMVPTVSLYYADQKRKARPKIRTSADASYFRPEEGDKIVLTFEPQAATQFDNGNYRSVQQAAAPPSIREHWLRDLIVALDAAERDKRFTNFVALKNFRDKYLTARGLSWTQDPTARHVVLAKAIDENLVLKGQVANPNSPMFPVTAIRINRGNRQVQEILNEAPVQRSPFAPVPIRGEPLSATVIRERR